MIVMLKKTLWGVVGISVFAATMAIFLYLNKPVQYYVLLKPWSGFDEA